MNPDNSRVPNFDMSPPPTEISGAYSVSPENRSSSPENTQFVNPSVAGNSIAPPAPALTYQPTGTQVQHIPQAPMSPQPIAPTPIVEEPEDEITRQAVAKAKDIVLKTSQDPYQQIEQLKQLKTDYINKRFQHHIKQTEDQSWK